MLVVVLWTILIFAKSPGAASATATTAAAAAAAAAAAGAAASATNKSTAFSDERRRSTSGAILDANGTFVDAVCYSHKFGHKVIPKLRGNMRDVYGPEIVKKVLEIHLV